ncbi:MAG: YceI family protein [Microscillaceae bacterium]|nr:YceI family protein [Microscillaceae bacterium]
MTKVENQWAFEPSHCKIGFSVRHFGISETEGFFHKYEGTIHTETEDFSDAQIEFKVEVDSIDTQDAARDEHLKSADFFDAGQFPILHFKSTRMEVVVPQQYKLHGDLTMRSITNPVMLDVEFGGIVPKDPFGNTKAGFLVEGKINRKDWGITWNRTLDFGGLAVGEIVKIKCNIELIKV